MSYALAGGPGQGGRQPTAALWRAAWSNGWWLRVHDMTGRGRLRWVAPVGAGLYLLVSFLFIGGAIFVHAASPLQLPVATLLAPLWLLWSLLPAIGGGGGEVESNTSLAPYPTSRQLLLVSGQIAAWLDLQYLIPVPALLAALVAMSGPSALIPGLCFVLGASALGQLGSWASVGGLRPKSGQRLGFGVVVLLLGAGVALSVGKAAGSALGALPSGWLAAALSGSTGSLVGWSLALSFPVVVWVTAGPWLVGRAVVARTAERSVRALRPARALPVSPWLSLVVISVRGVWRSLAFKAALLTSVAIPFIASIVFPTLDVVSLSVLTTLSAGASLAANAWAYEAGGTTLLLASPMARWKLLSARWVVTVTCLLVVVTCVQAAGLTVSIPGDLNEAILLGLLLSACCGAIGMGIASARPGPADLDSLRGKPTSFSSALSYSMQCGLMCGLLTFFVSDSFPAHWVVFPAGAVVIAVYGGWAWRRLRDGSRLASAFSGTR